MKKTKLINSEVSYLVADLGHKDSLVIGDAGLPVPEGVRKIDLAVSKGVPDFLSVFSAILSEQRVEAAVMAAEIKEKSPRLHERILEILAEEEKASASKINVSYVPHEEFKARTEDCRGAVRTGEFTPYANIILVSGVVF